MSTPNPFSTRSVRPGAIPFLFLDGTNASLLVDRLKDQGWRGQIIGPHGSGKSTLLAALQPALEAAGRRVLSCALHDGERRLPNEFTQAMRSAESAEHNAATIVVLDGYEQLGRWSRFQIRRYCKPRGWGLLVTAHQDIGLPMLWETSVTPELASQLVAQLMCGSEPLATVDELRASLAHHDGNLRDVLFELYDEYERERR